MNANPKILPKLCLTSRASLQLATDKLEQHNISGSVINEFEGAIARHIDTCEQVGKKVLKSKQIRCNIPPDNITITQTDKSKRLVALYIYIYIYKYIYI